MAQAVQVFKFGGASVKDPAGIRNVGHIIEHYGHPPLVVVVSAIGKTTDALETVMQAFAKTDAEDARAKFAEIKLHHFQMAHELFGGDEATLGQLNDAFVEVDWILEETYDQAYDYVYDQIVSIGEVASSIVLAGYLKSLGLPVHWKDARGLIRTDALHREAWVDWTVTEQQVGEQIGPVMGAGGIVVTQGFIGSTADNETTTLGREGSDYSAAIFSYCLGATAMSIWKDVPGVLTADPRIFNNVSKIEHLSYREAIEMTYYGAKVIHPKTIKPLQNKNIPLFVKSFVDPAASGTRVDADAPLAYPPIITVEHDQALVQIQTRDFSFVAEHHLKDLFNLIADHRLQVNLMQNTAISFAISVNDIDDRVDTFAAAIERDFSCEIMRGLELYTMRHADNYVIQEQRRGRLVLMDERAGATVQMVMTTAPIPSRKEIV